MTALSIIWWNGLDIVGAVIAVLMLLLSGTLVLVSKVADWAHRRKRNG